MRKWLDWLIIIALIIATAFAGYKMYEKEKEVKKQTIGEFTEFIQKKEVNKKEIKDLKFNELALKLTYTYKKEKYIATYPRNYIVTKEIILDTLQKKDIKYEIINEESKLMKYSMLFLKLAFYGLFIYYLFYIIREMSGGKFEFEEVKQEKTTFKDIAGYEYVKEELKEVVDFIKNPAEFEKYTKKVPKGILLEGPPGNGKTLLAKAVAGETDTPFFQISASDIEDKYVGSGAKKIEKIFNTVKKRAEEVGRVILFIDEIDAVGMKRENRTVQETNQTINKLLTEMDGFDKESKIIVMAATNLSSVLDEALTRSGRFDRIIRIEKPSVTERKQVIQLYLDKKGDLIDEEVKKEDYAETLAKQTEGFSNADLDKLVNEAALIAHKEKEETIKIKTLREAFTKIVAGVKTNTKVTEEDRKIVAYHEAGHIVATVMTHPDGYKGVAYATITPHGESLGHVSPVRIERMQRKSDIKNSVIVCLAGRAVEEKMLNGDYTVGAAGDLQQANRMLWNYVVKYGMSEQIENLFIENVDEKNKLAQETIKAERERLYKETKELIKKHYDVVEKMAEYLLEHTSIEQYELREVLKGTSYEETKGKID